MEFLGGKILCFVLVLTRIGAFFAVCPVFSWPAVPTTIRVAMTVIASIFFAGVTAAPQGAQTAGITQVVLILAGETLYGLALGYVAVLIFSAVRLGAELVEREMGLNLASILDPLSEEESQPLSMLVEMIFVLLFLWVNGHHFLLATLLQSYKTLPLATAPDISKLTGSIILSGSTMLLLGLKMAIPILTAFMALMVVLAVLARINPEMDIFFLSLPLKVGLGLLLMSGYLPFINEFVSEYARWMDKLLPL